MNLASLLVALFVTSAADTTGGDPVLLDFHAVWCGPCHQMRPEIEKLVRKGYPVKTIDIDQQPELAQRYGVTAVPTVIIVDADGRPLTKKRSGVTPAAQLASLYNEVKAQLPPQPQPQDDPEPRDQAPPAEDSGEGEPPTSIPVVNPKPWQTVVRIKMHLSDTEWGFGSGTIISSTSEESIILTCAHIFRVKGQQQPQPRDFRVPITVDLFNGQFIGMHPAMVGVAQRDVVGQAIDYDFVNDVGLIRIRPGRKLPASRVVPPDWHPKAGMAMFTVGCSHGNDATAWDTKILDPHVNMNTGSKQPFATIKCANQPKEGRSGGGLYTTDGYVAGVCDFADPAEHVGLYAVPEAIHKLLDRNKLMALYRRDPSPGDAMLASGKRTRPGGSTGNGTRTETRVRAQNPTEPDLTPSPVASINKEDVTIPPPSMFGIKPDPSVLANRKANQWGTDSARSQRTTRRPEVPVGDGLDPGPRPGEALTTDMAIDPIGEEKTVDPVEIPPVRPSNPTRAASSGGWKPARQVLPELTPR